MRHLACGRGGRAAPRAASLRRSEAARAARCARRSGGRWARRSRVRRSRRRRPEDGRRDRGRARARARRCSSRSRARGRARASLSAPGRRAEGEEDLAVRGRLEGHLAADPVGDADEVRRVLLREVLDAVDAGHGEVDRLARGVGEAAEARRGELDERRGDVAVRVAQEHRARGAARPRSPRRWTRPWRSSARDEPRGRRLRQARRARRARRPTAAARTRRRARAAAPRGRSPGCRSPQPSHIVERAFHHRFWRRRHPASNRSYADGRAARFAETTAIVCRYASVGLNSTISVPAATTGTWPGGA